MSDDERVETPENHIHVIDTAVNRPWVDGRYVVIPCGWQGPEGGEYEGFGCSFEAVLPIPADLAWERAQP